MTLAIAIIALFGIVEPTNSDFAPDGVPFLVAKNPWQEDGLGCHRAIVQVNAVGPFVRAHLPWRRRDSNFVSKAVIVTPIGNSHLVLASDVVRSDSDSADVIFEPASGKGLYACYYLPFKFDLTEGWTNTKYIPPATRPELPNDSPIQTNWEALPQARTLRFEARTSFDSFAPMELPATQTEVESLEKRYPNDYLVFPEDRIRPVRMFDRLPAKWAISGPTTRFEGTARPNEYYCFQIGVAPRHESLVNVRLEFSDLKCQTGSRIASRNLTCFNTGGTNWDGSALHKIVNIRSGAVLPLWFGVDVPKTTPPGVYSGTVCIHPEKALSTIVSIKLNVRGTILVDRGDSELWRFARLRWLNSTLGTNDQPTKPYTPVTISGNRLGVLGRSLTIGSDGLPLSINAGDQQVLGSPIRLQSSPVPATRGPAPSFRRAGIGRVTWVSHQNRGDWLQDVSGEFEFDGHASFEVRLKATRDMNVPGITLEVPYTSPSSKYFMGIGHRGGYTPKRFDWDWTGPYDSWWLGGVRAGLQVELRGGSYHGPLLNLYHPQPPTSWFNHGKGRVLVRMNGDRAIVRADTGPLHVKAGETFKFEFAMLITPVKPIDTQWQFSTRFYHNAVNYRPTKVATDAGANVVNVHHANDINPYINYPFQAVDGMRRFINEEHLAHRKVKIYDTIRELSNYTAELWPLLALDNEVFVKGDGGGFAWLQEHVGTGYVPSWYHPYPKSETADASMVTTGFSRWINYYIEGLSWLAKNVQIDGLYLDDVSFDRRVLKRMRRVLASGGREPMIDLHSNTGFSIGPANQYEEFFPYVDRLWFGESFDYNEMSPDRWLVETSGIPFGLMGEMLQGGGNRWLGMVFGMTTRFGWTNYETANNPDPIWRFWDKFGIGQSQMLGYWNPSCPVHADVENVQATVYQRKERVLVAVGNFGDKAVSCHLTIDWKAIGMDPTHSKLVMPGIENFQKERTLAIGEPVAIEAKRGWLIVIQPK